MYSVDFDRLAVCRHLDNVLIPQLVARTVGQRDRH